MKNIPGKIIFKTLVGSHSYGTNIEGSDIDYKGVYVQTPAHMYRHGYIPQVNVSDDEVYYEIGRFIELCVGNNPTVLELLYPPKDCVIHVDPIFNKLIDNRDKFLTKKCRYSFGGYAVDQIKKASGLEKKINWEQDRVDRKTIHDFMWVYPIESSVNYKSVAIPLKQYLSSKYMDIEKTGLVKMEHFRDAYLLFYADSLHFKGVGSEDSNEPRVSEVPKYETAKAIAYFNRDAYSIHCKEYNQYQNWLQNRNSQRYVDIEQHQQKIDGKNLLHCVRLIDTALEIATDKFIHVRRPNAQFLIDIRKGKYDLATLLEECNNSIAKLDIAFDVSGLPDKVDEDFIESLLTELRNELYTELK